MAGKGMLAIAKALGVGASTVQRQLRRLMPVAPSDNLPSRVTQWFTCLRAGSRRPTAGGSHQDFRPALS
jgi:hypothetical protein